MHVCIYLLLNTSTKKCKHICNSRPAVKSIN